MSGILMATGCPGTGLRRLVGRKAGPQLLHVPEMGGRYYSMQFTDPTSGANFAYVGKRTTGTGTGDFLLCAPKWEGDTPDGMTRIDVPHRAALLVSRVFVADEDEDDRDAAYALAKQIQLTPQKLKREQYPDRST